MNAGRLLTLVGFLVGAAALILQFWLSVPAYLENGLSLPAALVRFFSFFTILTNLTLVLVYLSDLVPWGWLGWFRTATTRAMMAGVMVLVMVFYHLLLSGIWDPQGLFKVADVSLHYVTPILYVIWWALAGRRGPVAWAAVPVMLIPSLIYLAYVMARGAMINEYPYPILEAHKLGYGPVLVSILLVAAGLTALFAIAVFADKTLPRRNT